MKLPASWTCLPIRTTLVLACCWLLTAAVTAQESTFEGETEVLLVEVPVNVVMRDGEPVRGLTAENFEIYDSGDKQEIVGFETVDLELLHPSRQELQRDIDRLPPVARRHILLLFDLSFSTPNSIIKAREAAQEFVLSSLHPTDLAAVATFSLEHGPRLLVTFTPDRAQLARAIETLGVPELLARGQVVDPLRFVIEEPIYQSYLDRYGSAAGGTGSTPSQILWDHLGVLAMQADRAQKAYERRRITSWSRALGDTARALATVEGRKHVVYFSEGFDGRLLLGRDPDPLDAAQIRDQRNLERGQLWMVDNDDRFGNTSLLNDVNTMLEEFRRADCVIQAVDIGGLRADGLAATSGASTSLAATKVGQDALFYVAHETGGELFEDANDLDLQLSRLLERTSVTYILSFYPKDLQRDGAYHKLKVKANLPKGARLSHRPGYYAPRSYQELHPLEKALLASEAIAAATPRQEVGIHVLAAPFRASPELAYVPVIVEVEGSSLLASHEGDELAIEFYAYVTNARGEMRDFFTQVVQLDLGKGRKAISRTGVKYYGHLDITPGDYLLRVLVRNSVTGRTGVASIDLLVPPYDKMEPAMLPPFFAEQPGRWLLVREKLPASLGETVIYPFTIKGEPYVPAAKPKLRRNQEAEFYLVGYNLGDGELALDGKVLSEDGQAYDTANVSFIERTVTGIDGVDKMLASFNPKGLDTGEYTLQVEVINTATGMRQSNSIPFVIN